MPRLKTKVPRYTKHKASGQAVVRLDGHDIYLGPYGSQRSRAEYDRIIAEWISNGRKLADAPREEFVSGVEVCATTHHN